MNFASENEYNALIDALKNITDVVSVLTNKINSQEEEILKVKKNNENLENKITNLKTLMQNFKINSLKPQNILLNTENEQTLIEYTNKINTNETNETNESNEYVEETNDNQSDSEKHILVTEATTIGETEIENIKKNKAIQIVDKLIQKKKELTNANKIEKDNKEKNEEKKNDVKKNDEKINDATIIRRKNKIMRRF
jgi:hypothetical protein